MTSIWQGLKTSLKVAVCVPVFLQFAAAQGLPSFGGSTDETALPLHLEQRLGNIIRGQARNDRSFVADYDLYDYLNQMAARLAKGTDVSDISVFPLRDPAVNAFAMPGGVIGMHSGLFTEASSESELAGVLAHEIAHVKQRHIAQKIGQQSDGTLLMIASILGAIAASGQGGGASLGILMFGQAAAVDKTLAFSRHAESDADREGFKMLNSAGYDPKGMASFFGKLDRMSRLNQGNGATFATTHPLSIERMSDMENRIMQLPSNNTPSSLDFYLFRSIMSIEETEPSKAPDLLQRFEGRVRTETAKEAKLAAQLGVVRTLMGKSEWERAEKEWQQLRAMAQTNGIKHILIDRTAIEIAFGQKQYERALQLTNQALQQWGTRMSLMLLRFQTLNELGRYAEILKDDRKLPYSIPEIYRLQATAYDKTDQPMLARMKTAEHYLALSMTTPAIQQLQEALKYATTFQDKSILDTRIKELMQRRREEDDLKKRFS